jgi:hypothetical protein
MNNESLKKSKEKFKIFLKQMKIETQYIKLTGHSKSSTKREDF